LDDGDDSAANVTVMSWDEAVRECPDGYFGAGRQHPDPPTMIVAVLMMDAFYLHDRWCSQRVSLQNDGGSRRYR
jgi:hypothetical protein